MLNPFRQLFGTPASPTNKQLAYRERLVDVLERVSGIQRHQFLSMPEFTGTRIVGTVVGLIFKHALRGVGVDLEHLSPKKLNAIVARMGFACIGVSEQAGYPATATALCDALSCFKEGYDASEAAEKLVTQYLEDVRQTRAEFPKGAVVAEEAITLRYIDRGMRPDLRMLGECVKTRFRDRPVNDASFNSELTQLSL